MNADPRIPSDPLAAPRGICNGLMLVAMVVVSCAIGCPSRVGAQTFHESRGVDGDTQQRNSTEKRLSENPSAKPRSRGDGTSQSRQKEGDVITGASVAGSNPADSLTMPTLIYLAGTSLDAASTWQALSHGAHEANPILPSGKVGIVLSKAAVSVGVIWSAKKLAKSHPALAKTLLVIGGGTGVGAGVLNLQATGRTR